MVYWPLRKFYHIAKFGIVITLVVALLTLFEHWRGGKRTVRAQFSNSVDAEFEREVLDDEARIVAGLGEGGAAVFLQGEEKRLGEESEKKLAMNVYLSDRIPYNRTLRDYRHPACTRVVYDAELPSASVVIIFHNEPYSVVVRTLWSVINSVRRDLPCYKNANFVDRETGKTMTLGYPGQDPTSPFVYLKEIILVDDNSTLPELKGKLSHYIRTRLPPGLIRIMRLPDRQGLMMARITGARAARGDVLMFLDAHCEPGADWLRPLLQRVRHKRDAVVTPLIDVIDQTTFALEAAENFQVGGFTFAGHFTWIDVPERERKRRGSDISPTWSPTMAGGLFAMSRAYYWELGAYDEQMAGWGGENLELSFRIWQCGGTLETIPCSRVGHVFRSFHPYGLPAHTDTHGINTARMAEVWMDEYAELFYLHRPDLRKNPSIGDVTHRKVLREKLHCRSFQWYLDNVYREKFVPVRDAFGYGRFRNPATQFCLDSMQRESDGSPLGAYPCHGSLQATQYLTLSLAGELRDEERCADVNYVRRKADGREEEERRVVMTQCRDGRARARWRYSGDNQQLRHVTSGLCLEAARVPGGDVLVRACSATQPLQHWEMDYSELNHFHNDNLLESSDQEENLRKLRVQRRISRSLLSYPEDTTDGNPDVNLREESYERNEVRSAGGNSSEGGLRQEWIQVEGHNSSNLARPWTAVERRHSTHDKKAKRQHKGHLRKHSHKHSKRKHGVKDKFILKLLRKSPDTGAEEHLEVDVHCKHRQLYPNNSFVRDIVTILNDKEIKVINNGRIFEKNRVTELGKSPKEDHPKHKDTSVAGAGVPVEATASAAVVAARVGLGTIMPPTQQLKNLSKKKKRMEQKKAVKAVNIGTRQKKQKEKKIIVEEFVEVTSPSYTTETSKVSKKKQRHGHIKSTTTSAADAFTQAGPEARPSPMDLWEETKTTPQSAEDAPMVSAEVVRKREDDFKDDAQEPKVRKRLDDADVDDASVDQEDPPEVGRRPHQLVRGRGGVDSDADADADADVVRPMGGHKWASSGGEQPRMHRLSSTTPAAGADGAPLKVVMRSNLTFNLADDFFDWRRRDRDDLQEVLEEVDGSVSGEESSESNGSSSRQAKVSRPPHAPRAP